jgi:hypothetical protein
MTHISTMPSARTHHRYSLKASALAACAGIVALGCGAITIPSDAFAAPAGTACGTVVDNYGATQPVTVLKGDVDCPTATDIANSYFHDPAVVKADWSTAAATVDGWQCSFPDIPGRPHDEAYLECDLGDNGFQVGN